MLLGQASLLREPSRDAREVITGCESESGVQLWVDGSRARVCGLHGAAVCKDDRVGEEPVGG